MKDTIRNILLTLLAVIIVVGGTYTAIQWDAIVGKWETEAEREVFKQTTTYSEAAASFLADSYKQYNEAETEADKNTIMEMPGTKAADDLITYETAIDGK